jgi:DNA-binding transcriptional regulator YiaG
MLYVIHVYHSWQSQDECFMSRVTKPRRRAKRDFALALTEWRKRNKLSQSGAALKLKISRRTLQEWEQARAIPHHLALDALRDKIGL